MATATELAAEADAIVTDLCIEGWMDGVAFVARVRAAEKEATRIPILVVTAHVQGATRAHAIMAGADMVFAKPCPPEMLAAALRQATQMDTFSAADKQAS